VCSVVVEVVVASLLVSVLSTLVVVVVFFSAYTQISKLQQMPTTLTDMWSFFTVDEEVVL